MRIFFRDQLVRSGILANKAVLWMGFTLWIGLEYYALGPSSYLRIFDNGDSLIPQNIAVARDFLQHGIHYWYAYAASGVDLLAEGYWFTNVYFGNLIFIVFPGWLAYQITILLGFFLCGYCTYLLCKKQLGLSETGSIFAGFAYALLGGDVGTISNGILPFLLLCLDRLHRASAADNRALLLVAPLAVIYASCTSLPTDIPFALPMIPVWFYFVLRRGGGGGSGASTERCVLSSSPMTWP